MITTHGYTRGNHAKTDALLGLSGQSLRTSFGHLWIDVFVKCVCHGTAPKEAYGSHSKVGLAFRLMRSKSA